VSRNLRRGTITETPGCVPFRVRTNGKKCFSVWAKKVNYQKGWAILEGAENTTLLAGTFSLEMNMSVGKNRGKKVRNRVDKVPSIPFTLNRTEEQEISFRYQVIKNLKT